MHLRLRVLGGAATLVALLALLLPSVALAHERRAVGKYTFVVGFLNEPAIQGEPNGLDLTVTDAQGNPVDGVDKTLKVGISYGGGAPKDLPLRARFGLHGKYTADVIPTKAGTYAFTFNGTINGDPVTDARFESGPNTFNDVDPATSLQFPVQVPATSDLAQQTQSANDAAQAALQRATLFGLGGVAVGLVGIVLAVVALAMRARPVLASPDELSTPSAEPVRPSRG
jgi:hypothetical protein